MDPDLFVGAYLLNTDQPTVYTPEHRRSLWVDARQSFRTCAEQRELLVVLTQRNVLVRYRGSVLGLVWSFIHPLVLLGVYTVVFAYILKMKWNIDGPDRPGEFPMMLFCGLVPFLFFAEAMGQAPNVILSQPNYVKRIAFPLELLPVVAVGTGLIHMLISFGVLLLALLFFFHTLSWTVVLLPLVLAPLVISSVAFAIVLSAAGVFIRDLEHTVSVAMTFLFFLTPIFYSSEHLPPKLHFLLYINPVAYAAANIRKVLVHGVPPNWDAWVISMLGSAVLLFFAAGWFQRIRRRFSDVL